MEGSHLKCILCLHLIAQQKGNSASMWKSDVNCTQKDYYLHTFRHNTCVYAFQTFLL